MSDGATIGADAIRALRWDQRGLSDPTADVVSEMSMEPEEDEWHPEPSVRAAAKILYSEWYCGATAPRSERPDARSASTQGAREVGVSRSRHWSVEELRPDGSAYLAAGAVGVLAIAGTYTRAAHSLRPLTTEDVVDLHLADRSSAPEDGWLWRFGREPGDALTSRHTVRLYLNLRPGSEHRFMEACTCLDDRLIPYRAKVLAALDTMPRRDAGVVYVPARYVFAMVDGVVALYREVAGWLLPEVPPMTRCMAPGLSVAESPSDGMSFGTKRSRLLARIAYEAASQKWAEDSLEMHIEMEMRAQSIDPARPHLENSEDPWAIDKAATAIADAARV